VALIRKLREAREAIRLSVRRFAEEAGVSTRTLQDHEAEGGRVPRRDVAEKYAAVLRRYGVDPTEVQEVAEGLGEVFVVDLDPHWKLREHMLRGLREDLIGLVRTGDEEAVRRLVEEVVNEYGAEGNEARQRAEAEHQRLVDENQEGGQM
jgi:transcriptional regulator with XRE-family HTH domain